MKIVCQKCGATYHLDERLLGTRGVRAMCPSCRHQQSVRPEPDGGAPRPGSVAAIIGAGRPANAAGSPPPPQPRPGPGALELDTSQPPPPGAIGSGADLDRCRSCGALLDDSFDRAIGTCDACRQEEAARQSVEVKMALVPAPPAGPPGGFSGDPPPARSEEPLELAAAPRGHPPLRKTTTSGGGPRASTGDTPARAPGHPSGAAPVTPPRTSTGEARAAPPGGAPYTRSAMRTVKARPRWVLPVAIAGGAALLAGAAVGVAALRRPAEEPLPAAIQAVLPRWRLEFMDLSGSAAALVEQGGRQLSEDRPLSYREAEESFQRALLLDPQSDAAIAGFGQALALGRGASLDEETRREAVQLVQAARARGGETMMELVAEANLLLSRSPSREELETARQLAERAVTAAIAEEKGQAHLALGRSYLETSGQLAIHNFTLALQSPLPPRRAYYYRGLAHASIGEFRAAIADLERRLELDPGQSEVLGALASIYEEVGEPGLARQVYLRAQKAHPEDVRIPVQLAVLTYQAEARPKDAATALRVIISDAERMEQEVVLDACVHLAAAERAVGQLEAAAAAGARALQVDQDDPAAHLQLLLVALDRQRPDEAATHLPFIEGRLEDRALEQMVAGRVAMAQGRHQDAYRQFWSASEADPRRVDALLAAGVAAARAGQKDQALQALFKAVHGDPTRVAPRRPVTRFFLRDGETLDGLEGVVPQLSAGEGDVMPYVYEGIIRYHQRASAEADRLFARVLSEDSKNSIALAFRALAALQRGEKSLAITYGQRAGLLGKQVPVARYAEAMALLARGATEEAKKVFREVQDLHPSFVAAEVRLAELEARNPRELKSARARLVRALGLDPSYAPAKRALYELERREGPPR
jgi:tetratricopeptide (TPR) repeat protein